MIRRSCLPGIVLSYLPLLARVGVVVALAAWADLLRTALWLALAALAGYSGMISLTRGQRLQGRGMKITRQDQPALMAAVDDIMGRAGIRRLDGVWLGAGGNAWVISGHRDWLGRRHVGLGIGLLAAAHLSTEELRAILAHEAGHLSNPDRARHLLGARRRYARARLRRKSAKPLWWYWRWLLKMTREQGVSIERHADAVSARMCGTELAQRARYRIAEVSILHEIAVQSFVRQLWRARLAPATLFEIYEHIWAKEADKIEAAVTARMNAPDAPRDTHPGLAERCGNQRFPRPARLRGDLQLERLEELDRQCTGRLTQRNCLYAVKTLPWPEITPDLINDLAVPSPPRR